MRLLFDQNLSPRLIGRLEDVFPGSSHVSTTGLDRSADEEVFAYALREGYAVVSKDADFAELVQVRQSAPKVVWLRLGNSSTAAIEEALRANRSAIETLEAEAELRVVEIF